MSRKSQQKKARKEAKRQRSTPSKPWVSSPPQQARPDIKISEAILNISEPLPHGSPKFGGKSQIALSSGHE